jgi:ABC-type uncharacterized transport system ATPase subunit
LPHNLKDSELLFFENLPTSLEKLSSNLAILFSSTDIDEIWEYSDIIFSVSGNKIIDINYKDNLTKDTIIKYVSGLV